MQHPSIIYVAAREGFLLPEPIKDQVLTLSFLQKRNDTYKKKNKIKKKRLCTYWCEKKISVKKLHLLTLITAVVSVTGALSVSGRIHPIILPLTQCGINPTAGCLLTGVSQNVPL